jgi:hypothetical protein
MRTGTSKMLDFLGLDSAEGGEAQLGLKHQGSVELVTLAATGLEVK